MTMQAVDAENPKGAPPSRRWGRYLERALWLGFAGIVLYRCVLPVPSLPLGPEAESARVAVGGMPMMVEFSASR